MRICIVFEMVFELVESMEPCEGEVRDVDLVVVTGFML